MKENLPANIPSTLEPDIEQHGRIMHFYKEQVMFSPEELLQSFFVVFQGRIKVSQIEFESGKEQTFKILTTGDMYDMVALLDGELHENLLTALDDETQIMRLPMKVVRSFGVPSNTPDRCTIATHVIIVFLILGIIITIERSWKSVAQTSKTLKSKRLDSKGRASLNHW